MLTDTDEESEKETDEERPAKKTRPPTPVSSQDLSSQNEQNLEAEDQQASGSGKTNDHAEDNSMDLDG